MKILSIRLKNLASIEGTFEVDFTAEPLQSAGIFAISGPTGAGKSTILDALCLALYDKAPRFAVSGENLYLQDVGDNKINQSDVRNILRRGTGEGFAEVDFLSATGRRYRSRWSIRRARSKSTGSLQPQVMQIIDLDTEDELQGTKTELLAQLAVLVGLTYDQFTRTVLLAQNDFATFLKSKESAKAELLEKLTGTEIYSRISREVYAHSKAADEAFRRVKDSVGLIELLTQEELDVLVKDKGELSVLREAGVKQLSTLKEQFATLRSFVLQQELFAKKQQEEGTQSSKLKELQAGLEVRTQNMEIFRQQCEALQPELNKARALDVQIQTAQKVYMQANDSLQAVHKQSEEGRAVVTAKEKRMLAYRGELHLPDLLQMIAAEGSISEGYAVIANGDAGTNDVVGAVSNIASELQQGEKTLSQAEKLLVLFQQADDKLQVRLNAFGIEALGKEQTRLTKEQSRLQQARQTALDWGKVLQELQELTAQLSVLRTKKGESEKEMAELAQLFTLKETQVKTLQRVYDNARTAMNQSVSELRGRLLEGEACPVCGSKEHPYGGHGEVVDTIYRGIEEEYQAASAELQQLNNRSISLKSEFSHMQREEGQLSNQFATRQEQEGVFSAQLMQQVEKEFALSLSVEQKEAIDFSILFAARKQEAERLFKYFEEQLEGVKLHLHELSGKLQQYQQLYTEWQQQDGKVKRLRKGSEALRSTISACHLLLQEVEAAKEKLSLLLASEEKEQKRFTAASEELQRYRTQRGVLLRGKTVEEAEAAVRRRETELNTLLDADRKEVERCRSGIAGLQGEMRQLNATIQELTEKKALIESPDNLSETIAVQQTLNEENNRKFSLLEAKLLQQEQNRIRLQSIEKELKEKQEIAIRWEKLNKLIGSADGNKFKVIAQSYTLNLLLLHANKHLSYLSRRYKLQQVPETLALQVVDGDMCDEVRTVYSLSGGESFLISLALALGLSSLSSNNLQVESLFIDEGFGSLDADSLRTAMEALEMLQMQGRKIGVISHVQEMSERIAVQVRVHKSVNGKSRIEII
ncbi:AAA family ATPase [Bacteroides ihuae]|uniref:AAA family ATPase n=1 Tax=Bacteroides ihuae TaxID=1852362 RepID=UPI0008D965F9|nr:AAA family ATPase [Bacteroides ihuae]